MTNEEKKLIKASCSVAKAILYALNIGKAPRWHDLEQP